jgi:hypothetical protein
MKICLCTENNFRESPAYGAVDWEGGQPPIRRRPLIRRPYSGGQLLLKLNGGPRLAALLSESPARIFLPSSERLMLPWDD